MAGLLDTLAAMAGALEDIQKSLDMFLETKRRIFPRFYFLSNDDLLEVLGQARSPDAVQPHLKKCFDSLRALRVQKVLPPSQPGLAGHCLWASSPQPLHPALPWLAYPASCPGFLYPRGI